MKSNDLNCTRLGLSVSRKVGGAVLRNRIKRLLREAFRLSRLGEQRPGFDLVCIPRGGQFRSLAQYQTSLRTLFARGKRKLSTRGERRSPRSATRRRSR